MPDNPDFHDSHFHLTNYIQEGISIEDYLAIMSDRVGRSTLFGIPLQQTWSYGNSGDFAPGYYLHSDAPLYYYSFTDAYIARVYQQLLPEQQQRFDPMITGFNPADMRQTISAACLRYTPECLAALVSSAYTRSSFRLRSQATLPVLPIRHLIASSNLLEKPAC